MQKTKKTLKKTLQSYIYAVYLQHLLGRPRDSHELLFPGQVVTNMQGYHKSVLVPSSIGRNFLQQIVDTVTQQCQSPSNTLALEIDWAPVGCWLAFNPKLVDLEKLEQSARADLAGKSPTQEQIAQILQAASRVLHFGDHVRTIEKATLWSFVKAQEATYALRDVKSYDGNRVAQTLRQAGFACQVQLSGAVYLDAWSTWMVQGCERLVNTTQWHAPRRPVFLLDFVQDGEPLSWKQAQLNAGESLNSLGISRATYYRQILPRASEFVDGGPAVAWVPAYESQRRPGPQLALPQINELWTTTAEKIQQLLHAVFSHAELVVMIDDKKLTPVEYTRLQAERNPLILALDDLSLLAVRPTGKGAYVGLSRKVEILWTLQKHFSQGVTGRTSMLADICGKRVCKERLELAVAFMQRWATQECLSEPEADTARKVLSVIKKLTD